MTTTAEIARLIPDRASRLAWIAAGMPTDLGVVASLVLRVRRARVRKAEVKPRVRASRILARQTLSERC